MISALAVRVVLLMLSVFDFFSLIHCHLLLAGLIRQGARCKACKMSVHHKCRDNVPYCPGDRVSNVQWDSLVSRRPFRNGGVEARKSHSLRGGMIEGLPPALNFAVNHLYN